MNQYIGRLLDNRYEILEMIGTGGMAVVYKALCHRLNRLVAVKILKDEFSGDEEFRRRFRAEGEAVAMLSHPNIVQVFDVSSADNANFIVMELIDGISLKQYMEVKGVLNWKETLHFAMQIAKGLEHAHSRGIVHRDIKPHNVMVLKDGSVKVMDFGIARVMSKSNTLTKEALGSVHYISPEQAKGSYTDNRSDLYSLGVVMYEMMTGRPPFDGESPVAVAIQHINGGAPKPSSLNPNIPGGMEQIILKAMALDMKDRYASATEMLQDMEEFRKNPAIVFDYALPAEPVPAKPAPANAARTTAEKVVQAKHGTSRQDDIPRQEILPGQKRSGNTESRSVDALRRARLRRKEEERRKKERSRVATLAVVACSIVAVIAIVFFLLAVFNGALLKKNKDLVSVPYLIGETYTDAIPERYRDFSFRFMPQQYDDNYQKGEIMHQEPAGGEEVQKGTEIVITVSMGREPNVKTMEDLTGLTRERAESFLNGQNYDLQIMIFDEPNTIVPAGKVIRTEPGKGLELSKGQTVRIWVSTGPEVILGTMPDVVGMDRAVALQVLEQLGFNNVTVHKVESQRPRDQVLYQSEKKKAEIDVTTEIVLEISEGPKETVAPETKPTEHRPEPTEEEITEPEEVTMLVSFSVPTRVTMYGLTILRKDTGDIIVNNVEIPAGSDHYEVMVTGSGVQEFRLFVDGVEYETQRVNFDG